MRRALLAVSIILVAASASATDYHVSPPGGSTCAHALPAGAGSACSLAAPCSLHIATCGTNCSAFNPQPGDTIKIHRGIPYQNGGSSGTTGFVIKQPHGTKIAPLIYRGADKEKAIIECKQESGEAGNCFYMHTPGSVKDPRLDGQYVQIMDLVFQNSTLQTRFGNHGSLGVENGSKDITWNFGSKRFIVNTTSTVTVATGSDVVTWANIANNPTFTCVKTTSTVTTSATGNTVTRTAGANFTVGTAWVGKDIWINNAAYTVAASPVPTATVLALTTSPGSQVGVTSVNPKTTVDNTTLNKTGCGGVYNDDDIILGGVRYVVANSGGGMTSGVDHTKRLRITTPYLGAPGNVTAYLPSVWSDGLEPRSFTINSTSPSYSQYAVSYCPNATTCVLKTAVTEADGDYVSQFPHIGLAEGTPYASSTVAVAGGGSGIINCLIFDDAGGTDFSGNTGGNNILYGNVKIYAGSSAVVRAYGHGGYYQSPTFPYSDVATGSPPTLAPFEPATGGIRSTSYVQDNIFSRCFWHGVQMYEGTSYLRFDGNGVFANNYPKYPGHGVSATPAWGATGGGAAPGVIWTGSAGLPKPLCPLADGTLPPGAILPPNPGDNFNWEKVTGLHFDRNLVYGVAASVNHGNGWGSCDSHFSNNRFLNTAVTATSAIRGGFGPSDPLKPAISGLRFTNNLWTFPYTGQNPPWQAQPSGTWGPGGTLSDTDTFTNGLPSSGADFVTYRPNRYEQGRCLILVDNQDSSATVNVNLVNTGGIIDKDANVIGSVPNGCGVTALTGQYKIFNHQDPDYWDSNPIKTGTCGASPCTVTLPTTCGPGDAQGGLDCVIKQPAFTGLDLVTPFPKPPDLGPRVVAFIVIPNWAAAAPPTATPTFTSSSTATRTFTRTSTATNTATRTFTGTITNTPSITPTRTNTPILSSTASSTPTRTATATPSLTASPTPTMTPTPSGGQLPLSWEFTDTQSCVKTAPMADGSDEGGTYVSSPSANNGMVACTFGVQAAGTYRVWLLTYGADSTHDSFFTDVDGDSPTCLIAGNTGCPNRFHVSEQIQPCEGEEGDTICEHPQARFGEVFWNPLNDDTVDSCGECTASFFVERRLNLNVGPHTITFRQRDADSRLYRAIVTNDMTFDPGGNPEGPTPTPTPGLPGVGPAHRHPCAMGPIRWMRGHAHSPGTLQGGHTHQPFCGPVVNR